MRRFHALSYGVWAAGFLLASALSAGPAGGPVEDRRGELWYALELDGRPAGWAVERWWSEDGRVVTESETSLRVARGTTRIEIDLAGRFVETAGGEPLTLWTRRALGSDPVETTYRYAADRLEAETRQGGRTRREILEPPSGEWLTPAAARRAVARRHAAGDTAYALRVVDPVEGPDPVLLRRTRIGEAMAPEAAGRWHEELSSAPGVLSVVELDESGTVVRSTTELLGMEAVLRRTDRESALAAADPGGGATPEPAGAVPEVLLATLVRPDRPIDDPRSVREAVFELTLPGGTLPDLPEAGGQRIERRGERLRVTVTAEPAPSVDPPPGARPLPPDADGAHGAPDGAGHLAASVYLDHDDPAVRRLLARVAPVDADPVGAAGSGGDPRVLARALTTFVHGYVAQKGLDTGFATASQVARSRSGDCTEHAVLLAALLRAADIPSRVVTGLVYLEDFAGAREVFGYHMWVQAQVDGIWLDLDPTLPWGFDATHIALGTSDLAGPGGGQALERLLPLVGKLRIDVIALRR